MVVLAVLFCLFLALWGCKKEETTEEETPATTEMEVSEVPQFPWPPPQASATADLSCQRLVPRTGKHYLKEINERITTALDSSGYTEKSYFSAPDGFAMVTRLEQIERDGTPKKPPARWAVEVGPLQEFSLSTYLNALFTANPGFYRLIVFIVTPHPFSQKKAEVSRDEAMDWLADGLNRLPTSIGDRELTNQYSCTALIYEFEQPEPKKPAALKRPGRLPGRTHLERAQLWNGLGS